MQTIWLFSLKRIIIKTMKFKILFLVCILFGLSNNAKAASAIELESSSKAKIQNFLKTKVGAKELFDKSKATLVFPGVYKAGIFFLGGEYGEGVLFSKDAPNAYYSLASGAFGWQLGAQKKTVMLLFMNEEVLNDFRSSKNWEVGADASLAVVNVGASGAIDTKTTNKPILAFVFDQKGLMYSLTLEGTKFTKINKD